MSEIPPISAQLENSILTILNGFTDGTPPPWLGVIHADPSGGTSAPVAPDSPNKTAPAGAQTLIGSAVLGQGTVTGGGFSVKYQALPDAPDVQISGSFDPKAPGLNLYKVTLDGNTADVAIKLDFHGRPSIQRALAVLDASGQDLAFEESGPNGRSLELNVESAGLSGNPAIYVMVAPILSANSSAQSLGDMTYTLDVRRQSRPEPSGSAGQLASDPTGGTVTTGRELPQEQHEPSPDQAEPESEAELVSTSAGTPASVQSPRSVVAVGPLPRRSAAALGGVLSEDDPAPTVDPASLAKIDLDLLLSPRRGTTPNEADALGEAEEQDDATDGLVTLRGPGGIPLLATALLATPRPPVFFGTPRPPTRVDPVESPPPADLQTADPTVVASHLVGRSSAVNGMTVAVSLLCGLVLPDIAAAGPPGRKIPATTRLSRLIRWARRGRV